LLTATLAEDGVTATAIAAGAAFDPVLAQPTNHAHR
jgi:hypothetical protein